MTKFFALLLSLVFSSLAFAGTYQVSCTNSSTTVIPENNSRKRVFIRNITGTAITGVLCFHSPCTTTTGFPLIQNAEVESIFVRSAITCITASGTATLAVIEE